MPTRAENAMFSANAYGRPLGLLEHPLPAPWKRAGWLHRDMLDVEATGFRAHVYNNDATHEVVIAYSGTHIAERGDLSAGWSILNGRLPLQFDNANAVYDAVVRYLKKENINDRISFTGHSLGGALAQYMAIPAKGCHAETFGAPGILDALGKLAEKYDPRYFYPVTNHIARSDMFGMYGRHLGMTRLYNFDLSDRIVPGTLPFYVTSLPALAMMIRMSHTIDRYLNAFRRGSGTVKPTGHVSYRDGKTKRKVKVFNWTGVARDEYI
jgi:hypothetical protein